MADVEQQQHVLTILSKNPILARCPSLWRLEFLIADQCADPYVSRYFCTVSSKFRLEGFIRSFRHACAKRQWRNRRRKRRSIRRTNKELVSRGGSATLSIRPEMRARHRAQRADLLLGHWRRRVRLWSVSPRLNLPRSSVTEQGLPAARKEFEKQ